ncbi:hypothetical protein PSTT_16221 [Puccinia striiformis]|uniref:Uncharacterized protein n=1 Tax=Puccinia striiformis TaxID=27350 RepID=A0A2S4UDY1_9BASI|nr:hypothetical protein PSTT_16221 [Puccinia striiformis]
MDDKLSCEALMEFTGLDQESTMTQILPYLKTFPEGFGDSAKSEEGRLRIPSLQSTQKSSASNLPTTSNLGNAPIKLAEIYNNFGNSANVYMKSRDAEASAAKSSKKKNTKSTLSETVTPEARLESTSNPDKSKRLEDPVTTANSKPDIPPDIDIPISELSPSTLKELLELKVILDGFESKTSTPRGTAQCFCEARSHGLPIDDYRNNVQTVSDLLQIETCPKFCPSLSRKISLELKKAQVQEADRAYPSLPTTSNTNKAHSHQQQAANNAPEEHSGKSSDQQSLQTTTIKPPLFEQLTYSDSTPQQQEHLTFNQAFDPEFYGIDHDDLNNPPYLDPFDDLSNLSSNLQPSLFVTEKLSSLHNTVPDCVPVDAHQV